LELKLSIDGPKTQYLNTTTRYAITVANTGKAAATNLLVDFTLAKKTLLVGAPGRGKSGGAVSAFTRTASGWSEQGRLTVGAGPRSACLGASLARLEGDNDPSPFRLDHIVAQFIQGIGRDHRHERLVLDEQHAAWGVTNLILQRHVYPCS